MPIRHKRRLWGIIYRIKIISKRLFLPVSVFDLFKVGIGPSSSHTVGPMRAARQFCLGLKESDLLAQTRAVKSELFGSLGATGRGHGSDKALLLGLEGETPEQVDVATVDDRVARIREQGKLFLLGSHGIRFEEKKHLLFRRKITTLSDKDVPKSRPVPPWSNQAFFESLQLLRVPSE